jgi:hypothetical protein
VLGLDALRKGFNSMQQPRSSSGLASLGGKLYAGRELREGDFMRVDMVIY